MASYNGDIDDVVAFTETFDTYGNMPGGLDDTMAIVDDQDAQIGAGASIDDTMATTEVFDLLKSAYGDAVDVLALTELFDTNGTFGFGIDDAVSFFGTLELNGAVYDGWSVNVATGAHARYSWSGFNSFASFGGKFYGARDDGVYELTGDDDAGTPIPWFLLTGLADFNGEEDKRVTHGYIAIKTNGSVMLKTVTGDNVTRVYRLESTNNSMLRRRLPLGRGVDAVYWQFALQDYSGEAFELDNIALLPVVLSRRFR